MGSPAVWLMTMAPSSSRTISRMVSFRRSEREYQFALVIDELALLVDDIVVFQQVLADIKVVAFDLDLGVLDGAC